MYFCDRPTSANTTQDWLQNRQRSTSHWCALLHVGLR